MDCELLEEKIFDDADNGGLIFRAVVIILYYLH